MTVFFSGEEMIQMAVQTEETGYKFYIEAEKKAKSEKLKELFNYLAKEEIKHKETYLKLKETIKEPAQGVPIDWDEIDSYIKAMTNSSFFLGGDKNINMASKADSDKAAIEYAIGFEKDTLLFFYQIKEIVKASEKLIIDKVIQEEKIHIKKLTAMKKGV